jgi:alpha-tubulin suppressor-like RCC1 family protein
VQGLNGQSVTTLVAAYANGGALLSNGQYYDWGNDSKGQLGNGTIRQNSAVPVRVPLPASVTQVAQGGSLAGNGQTLVMLSDGSL